MAAEKAIQEKVRKPGRLMILDNEIEKGYHTPLIFNCLFK